MFERARHKLKDWRLRSVVTALSIAYVGTALAGLYYFDQISANLGNFSLNFAASWLQDLAFFSIVGVAVFVHNAPFRPDQAHFDERIHAFYGSRAPSPLRHYAKKQLKKYGGYSPVATRDLIVRDYDEALDAYLVEINSAFRIKNLFDDVEYTDSPSVKIKPDSFDCASSTALAGIEWITIDEKDVLEGPRLIYPEQQFDMVMDFVIPPGGEIDYTYRYWMWMKVGELSSMTPQRVVERFESSIRNIMSDKAVRVQIEDSERIEEIEPGNHRQLRHVSNATPDDTIFRFKFIAESASSDLNEKETNIRDTTNSVQSEPRLQARV